MTEHPILFSGEMVRAILAGAKTQTRRLYRGHHVELLGRPVRCAGGLIPAPDAPEDYPWTENAHGNSVPVRSPYGLPGDRLWVRETWRAEHHGEPAERIPASNSDEWWSVRYAADEPHAPRYWARGAWRPSIHMPRWASRLTLEVLSVRVERLQAITEADAVAEGCGPAGDPWRPGSDGARERFASLWDDIYGASAPWDSDPLVWMVHTGLLPQ